MDEVPIQIYFLFRSLGVQPFPLHSTITIRLLQKVPRHCSRGCLSRARVHHRLCPTATVPPPSVGPAGRKPRRSQQRCSPATSSAIGATLSNPAITPTSTSPATPNITGATAASRRPLSSRIITVPPSLLLVQAAECNKTSSMWLSVVDDWGFQGWTSALICCSEREATPFSA